MSFLISMLLRAMHVKSVEMIQKEARINNAPAKQAID